jgi:hypothetical protein
MTGHVGDDVDGDVQLADRLGEDDPGEVVAERVLLPVDEVLAPADRQASRRRWACASEGAGRSRIVCGKTFTGRAKV